MELVINRWNNSYANMRAAILFSSFFLETNDQQSIKKGIVGGGGAVKSYNIAFTQHVLDKFIDLLLAKLSIYVPIGVTESLVGKMDWKFSVELLQCVLDLEQSQPAVFIRIHLVEDLF